MCTLLSFGVLGFMGQCDLKVLLVQKYNRIKCFVLNSELVEFSFLGQSDLKVLLVLKHNRIRFLFSS